MINTVDKVRIRPKFSYFSCPSPLPYCPSGHPDLSNEYGDEQENSREKEEIREIYEGDITD
jgi:hypothetical protein